ncbi:hypothetical protein JX265_007357 [Neoarthrinium moseri]|uniref:Zn(2)-C6 fungal-type domain-containing protein n=1 Tax=Neoarthrinium moseri TaxID=1658444 RepID=A0A9P9WK31_9PEZI|nr:uncharacterized protein JN550_009081 [Neoarthrinium moseri]KAI1843573.1 hypothetical protein JX266_010206 [Neoarthrinium moseri]KAI1864061.1 hypothetical protein JN550_009081 [Neoarthrinium moseri]KAI1867555.1 hypothetical protein JX265_007357 [Neoarthrinium moseri]
MPPGRPPKRPGEPEVEAADGTKCKLPRLDRGGTPNDFSSVVKSKLSSYTRTGQACDRCKVRKIRCDALPEGCSHCINQNLECYVTDRVTGRTERRGYMQELEREKTDMLNHIRDLEKLLGSNGVEVKPYDWNTLPQDAGYPPNVAYDSRGNPLSDSGASDSKSNWQHIGAALWVKDHRAKNRPSRASRSMVDAKPADVHLGVGSDQAPLSSIKGTTLSILGSTIDIGSFDAPDMDEPAPGVQAKSPLYNKSVQAFMQSCTNVNPQLHVEYPPRADAFTYAEWYFLMLYPFLPVLHKPTFMNILTRLYDDPNFKPTVSEVVMVHLVFASIYLQYGIRNRENPEQKAKLNELSNKHYHFSLSKFFDLATSKTFEDLQALTMIAVHTRSFPKPDCSSMVTWTCHGLAIELGLHRAMKKPGEETNLENEMRKRVWWTIIEMGVTLNGRMGKPMPIRLEEIDVDFPEMIPDELLTKDGVDTSRTGKCQYEIGAVGFKLAAIYLDMYSSIYCARKDPSTYPQVVEELEERVGAWQDELPESLRLSEGSENHNEMFALYAEYIVHEFRLCLRHPSVAMTKDPKLMAENSRVCEQAAKDMLAVSHKLYKLKSQDTTWYALSEYVAAMFTSLVAVWERRHDTTSAEVSSLRDDMNTWLVIVADTCDLMGCGSGLRDAVASIVDRTIAWIEHDRQRKGNPSAPPQLSQDMLKQSPSTQAYASLPNVPVGANHHNNVDPALSAGNGGPGDGVPPARNGYYAETASDSAGYPSLPYNEPPPQASGNMPYEANNPYLYAQAGQVTAAHVQAQAHAQAQVQQSQAPVADHNPLSAFAAQATQMAQPPPEMMWRQETPGGNTWHDWTAAVVDNQDRYSANALMSLGAGARPGSVVNEGGSNAPEMGMGVGAMNAGNVPTTANMQWPLLLFHDGTGVGGA